MAGLRPATQLKRWERAVVAALPPGEDHARKLMALGVLPGVELKVLQVFPGFVLETGNTRLAIDWEIAAGLMVTK